MGVELAAPAITAFYAGMLGIVLIFLSFAVVRQRLKHKVSIGDGQVPELAYAIRAHGNFIEYVPLALVFLLLMEMGGQGGLVVHLFGLALLVGRLLHAYGLLTTPGPSKSRFWGTVLTLSVVLIGGLNLLVWSVFKTMGG